jgi:hypothetical protein
MEKQNKTKKEVLQDDTLQKDLKADKEALEIHRLKEEIIGYVLLENNRDKLKEIETLLMQDKISAPKNRHLGLQGTTEPMAKTTVKGDR